MKTLTLKSSTFTITSTFAEMDHSVLEELAGQMLRELNGSLLMNAVVEFVLQNSYEMETPFSYDDITNFENTANIETVDGWEDFTEEQRDSLVHELEKKIEDLEDIIEGTQELSDEYQRLLGDAINADFCIQPEIYQWFLLDDRIITHLADDDQCTLDIGMGVKVWGRQGYGQSITMDNCIQKACYNIAYNWAV